MHYVYIIYSKSLQKFYTGYSQDTDRRLAEHNKGEVKFTSGGTPWEMVYFAAFKHKEDAAREERYLKSGHGRQRRSYLLEKFIASL